MKSAGISADDKIVLELLARHHRQVPQQYAWRRDGNSVRVYWREGDELVEKTVRFVSRTLTVAFLYRFELISQLEPDLAPADVIERAREELAQACYAQARRRFGSAFARGEWT